VKFRVFIAICIVIAFAIQIIPLSSAEYVHAQTSIRPEARGAHSMAFDPHNSVAVIFGGFALSGGWHYLGDTWVYSYTENSWTSLTLSPSPSTRSNHAMVYCNETNEIILYGGQGPEDPTDTWSFNCDTQTWSQVVTATNPGVHHSLAMAYDSKENVVILFGGFGDDGLERDDTWKFDCVTREWTELNPSTAPLARYGHVMVYDESINQVVLTSGNTATQGHQHDTWTYNTTADTWTELAPTGTPDRLKWPSMTYDSVNQKCILFGGQIGDTAVNRTWIYDAQLNIWQRGYPDIAPGSRINTGLAFDSVNGVTILFGGVIIDGVQYDDTWTYSYESNAWTLMESESIPTSVDPFLLVLVPLVITIAVLLVYIVYRRR
jgi:hypothetical protein